MEFTKEMVIDYADKLMIGLTDDEVKMVLDEFSQIDKDIDVINKIPNIKDVDTMSYALDDFSCVLREDEVEESVPKTELLRNASNHTENEVVVPRVVEE